MLRVLRSLWHGAGEPVTDATGLELGVAVPLVVVTVVLGLVPWLLLRITEPTVRHLLGLGRGEI